MNPPIPGSYDDLYAHYGNPHDAGFARNYIVSSTFAGHAIECHRVIAPLLGKIEAALHVEKLLSLIHSVDGCYVVRAIRGETKPSLHSWGLAIDLSAAQFPLGSLKQQDPRLVKAFADQDFFWGGLFNHRKDPMHFQFTRPHSI